MLKGININNPLRIIQEQARQYIICSIFRGYPFFLLSLITVKPPGLFVPAHVIKSTLSLFKTAAYRF
jgi:hypothetical protein